RRRGGEQGAWREAEPGRAEEVGVEAALAGALLAAGDQRGERADRDREVGAQGCRPGPPRLDGTGRDLADGPDVAPSRELDPLAARPGEHLFHRCPALGDTGRAAVDLDQQ